MIRLVTSATTFAAVLLLAAPAAAQPADAVPAERDGAGVRYRVSGFDGVGYGVPGMIAIRVGPGFSVTATGPAAALAEIRVSRRGDSLQIERRDRARRIDDRLAQQVRFTVTLPRLDDVALGGSARMMIDRVSGDRFEAAVGGSGRLSIGELAVGKADLSVGGSGTLIAGGRADRLAINLGGSGSVDLAAVRATRADVAVGGSGRVRAAIDGTASVSAAGGAVIDLGPRARCTISRSGSAQVRCGGN